MTDRAAIDRRERALGCRGRARIGDHHVGRAVAIVLRVVNQAANRRRAEVDRATHCGRRNSADQALHADANIGTLARVLEILPHRLRNRRTRRVGFRDDRVPGEGRRARRGVAQADLHGVRRRAAGVPLNQRRDEPERQHGVGVRVEDRHRIRAGHRLRKVGDRVGRRQQSVGRVDLHVELGRGARTDPRRPSR